MTIDDLISSAKNELQGEEGALAAEVLLAHVLNTDKARLFLDRRKEVDDEKAGRFGGLVSRHRMGEPVAYLIGCKEFFGLDFFVDKNVLIPRPETEMLVEKVLAFSKNYNSEEGILSVLDVGTGCGNIAVSLAVNCRDFHVTAVDVSAGALEVAKKNAVVHGVSAQIDFLVSDLLENVSGDFDVIVANLPYIGEEKFNFVSKEALDYEPHTALFGGYDGLRLYEKLFVQIKEKNLNPQMILGEFGFLQGDLMRELLTVHFGENGWVIEKDLASIERMFVVKSF